MHSLHKVDEMNALEGGPACFIFETTQWIWMKHSIRRLQENVSTKFNFDAYQSVISHFLLEAQIVYIYS
jgi:hypothetical protein